MTVGNQKHRVIGVQRTNRHMTNIVTIVDRNSRENRERRIRLAYERTFYRDGEPLGATSKVTHSIDLTTDKAIYEKPYRQPYKKLEIIKEQV